jgi:hypothetical protein
VGPILSTWEEIANARRRVKPVSDGIAKSTLIINAAAVEPELAELADARLDFTTVYLAGCCIIHWVHPPIFATVNETRFATPNEIKTHALHRGNIDQPVP